MASVNDPFDYSETLTPLLKPIARLSEA